MTHWLGLQPVLFSSPRDQIQLAKRTIQEEEAEEEEKQLGGNSLTVVTGLCLKKTKLLKSIHGAAVMSLATLFWIDKAALELRF